MAEHATGMRMARVSASPLCDVLRTAADTERLSAQLKDFCSGASFWLIDAGADHDQPFLLPEIAAADIVVLTGATPDSIKAAYGGVKTLHSRLARRHFQLLVAGAPADQAELIQQNIAAAANRYLGVSVQALGNIPADDRLWRAGQLERPVIEAFPMADASVALRGIATRLLDSASAGAAQAARALATEGG
jgi:flagellar biosynthesis protein FlhG